MKARLIIAGAILGLLAIAGCTVQQRLNTRRYICVDGIEYLVIDPTSNSQSMSVHLKPNGQPVLCAPSAP